jgi:hypothetical protein
MTSDRLSWLISEAIQHLGPNSDPKALAERVRRLQIGLPAEDEFSVLVTWLGRCKLVHKLDQIQTPASSREHWRIPDLFTLFEYKGNHVPALIEVKTSIEAELSWTPAYRDALVAYADLLNLPLLIAWRFHSFWTLFGIEHFAPKPTNYKIEFKDAMMSSLMSELAGDFSFTLRPGSGLHVRYRKSKETASGFDGRIEEVYWKNAAGEHFASTAPGVLPLFLCIQQQPSAVEDDPFVTQSFVIPEGAEAEFAYRALVTLLRLSEREDLNWRRTLENGTLPPLANDGLLRAANAAVEAGFVQQIFRIRPTVLPEFLERLGS